MWTEITRPQYERKGLRYSSDVTDAEWLVISAHLPPRKRFGRPPKTALRSIVDALLYMARTGCQWRLLPREFPPFTTVQNYFYAWRDNGILERINFELLVEPAKPRVAKPRVAKPVPRLGSSTVSPSRPPRAAAPAGMTPAKRSGGASAMSSPIRLASCSAPRFTRLIFKTATAPRSLSKPFTISSPGCAISSPTVPIPGTN